MDDRGLTQIAKAAHAVDGVAVDVRAPFAEVVLARPRVHNALNFAMWCRLGEVLEEMGRNPQIRVIILRGAGSRAFSAGADIAEFREKRLGIDRASRYNAQIARTLEIIIGMPQPVIAMIAGLAVGGGCEIAAACDLRIVSEDSRLGIPINRLGVTLGPVEAQAVVALIGPGHAKDLLLTGRLVDADEALRMGLVNRVVPRDALAAETWSLARRVALGAPLATGANKLTINSLTSGMPLGAIEAIDAITAEVYDSPDLQEGVAAFLEKREPIFRGRSEPA